MKCVILQPSYIPWRGYFHQIQKADVFVFYDDVQYDKHGWRNRNLIKGPNGPQWLTIPVNSKGAVSQHTPISEVRIIWDRDWTRTHWGTLKACYARTPYFRRYAEFVEQFYQSTPDASGRLHDRNHDRAGANVGHPAHAIRALVAARRTRLAH